MSSSLDTDVLIIGAGMSGIGFAIQLQKKYPWASFEIVEKSDDLGGTWWANTYPGCGCDVASHFYSYSFALKPDWTRKFALQPEIVAYFRDVAQQHDIPRHISFRSTVQKAEFDESTGTWLTTILDQKTGQVRHRRSRVLIAAVGALSVPKGCEIKGAERYQGRMFHSAQWDHSFDWTDKDVVVIGNGCSATQFVPILSNGTNGDAYHGKARGKARKVVQFSRQPHWIAERPNPVYSPAFKWTMRYVPLAMRLYRFYLYALMEYDFFGFDIANGRKIREALTRERIEYMKRTAPAKYHAALTPTTEIGCKRKVMDTDYYACLHNENMELVHDDPIEEVTETGVRTRSGREVYADAIILANGFQTQRVLYPLDIRGEGGVSLTEHWNTFSSGAAQAYYGTCISSFPNFFVMMGPNTATGHLSVIYTTECQINFTLRVLKPILQPSSPLVSFLTSPLKHLLFYPVSAADTVAVTADAERRDNDWIQRESARLVWASGCTSWYIDHTGRNTMLYPDWQFKYWLRSIFIPLSRDFVFRTSPKRVAPPAPAGGRRRRSREGLSAATTAVATLTSGVGVAIGVGILLGVIKVSDIVDGADRLADHLAGLKSWAVQGVRSVAISSPTSWKA
ncbi:hypothetical protein VTN96DRAFT_1027 [Rasamsonia emersonii]|uniref:Dimethylaniline monooxygenase n=1 Tax=Rasamsonia emersonii (strain ATCC 16479 / CBS 393.64 / IMI 116815) TaxID=1408163 RepID=A0A0F4Z529_RASE3|nr:Dimethylaniline monooxygenase [Rasamsonia emersonii CBS 393.64]KKA24998.1 Dimethylaniline monooxygenase [Rasamsonia emersonii CBS 393.64]